MNTQATEVKQVISKVFPEYNGRRISVQPFRGPVATRSYWSGGSRDYWGVTPLNGNDKVFLIPENGTPFTPAIKPMESLPEGFALVQYTRGPYESVTVYVNQINLAKLLPAPIELSDDEKTVLRYTSSFKPSYGGILNYRFVKAIQDTDITADRWEAAKATLQSKRLLNKAGAITDDGRNAIA